MEKAAGLLLYKKCCGHVMFLFLKASYGIMHWSPPKGHCDPHEQLIETAIRETEEECAINKSDIEILSEFTHISKYDVNGKPKTVCYWLAKLINTNKDIVLSNEHVEYRWVTFEDAMKLTNFEATHRLLRAANEFLQSKSKT
ncbi:hypothetical protein GJ496_002364 [Pomphorhynchus laevis]|nr:hypothetical protein GJ496_002364 [Pomphorhynchus laevis]